MNRYSCQLYLVDDDNSPQLGEVLRLDGAFPTTDRGPGGEKHS